MTPRALTEPDLDVLADIAQDRIRAEFARAQLAAMTWEPAPVPDTYQPFRRTR